MAIEEKCSHCGKEIDDKWYIECKQCTLKSNTSIRKEVKKECQEKLIEAFSPPMNIVTHICKHDSKPRLETEDVIRKIKWVLGK